MKKLLKRIVLGLLAVIVTGGLGLTGYASARWDRTFDAPLPNVHASTDSAVVARGRYLAYGPAMCAECHVSNELTRRVEAGEEVPLGGGHEWKLPVGTIRSPNLTPDPATGIGRYTDAQLARMLRHMVKPDGRAAAPFMGFQNLSDDDVVALISFLRAQPAVRNAVESRDLNLIGKMVATFLIKPKGPEGDPPAHTPAGPSVERGRYIVTAASDCVGCHTARGGLDGHFTGPKLGGGGTFPMEGEPNKILVSPNLTPDPKSGRVAHWTEDQFVARFRQGKVLPKSYMPWGAVSRMTEDDLRSVYRYLQSIPPVAHDPGPSIQEKKS
jgi:mono/diheme cytochrome c family protein